MEFLHITKNYGLDNTFGFQFLVSIPGSTIGPYVIKKVSLFGTLGHFNVDVQNKIHFIIFIGWHFIHP